MLEKKPKKVSFTEQDAATITQRYDATTVLTLLQEVAQYPEAKIDWNELVKKTSTGISNAREYQMLWRNLAYRDSLVDNLEDGAQPLDDDSDLECELEASPAGGVESTAEAAACVKVMIASRVLSESTPSSSTIEAPLTINVPVCHSSRTPNESSESSDIMQGTNIVFPVTIQRQTLPTVSSTDGIEPKGSGGGNVASKRRRAAWSEEEDKQLRAAVQRWGEGNWATMVKEDNFPIKKSPTQLAQRWSVLRKRDGITNSGTILANTPYTTAEQLATRHSLSLALDMPFKKITASGTSSQGRTSLNTASKNQVHRVTSEALAVHPTSIPPQHPSQQPLPSVSSAKSRLVPEKPVARANPTPIPDVKAIALAAGARIISPVGTASQLKVPQVRNVPSTSSSLAKSSTLAGLASESKVQSCTTSSVTPVPSQAGQAASLPSEPKVQSCTTSSAAPVPSQAASLPSESKVQSCTTSSAAPVPSQAAIAIKSPASCTSVGKASTTPCILSKQDKHVTGTVNGVPIKQEANTCPAPKERVQNNEKLDQDKSVNIKEGTTLAVKSVRSEEAVETTENQQIAVAGNVDKGSHDFDQEKCKNPINGSSEIKP